MNAISIQELQKRFPDVKDIKPHGWCIVVPGDKFDPDWEFQLEDQGYKVRLVELNRKSVALVSLVKKVGEGSEKLVYTPPPKPIVEENGSGPEPIERQVDIREVARVARHKKYGDDWRPEEDSFLIDLHKQGMPYWKIAKQLQEKFPNRTDRAIFYRIGALLKEGKLKPRFQRRKQRPKKDVKKPQQSDKVTRKERPLETSPTAPSELKRLTLILDSLVTVVDKLGCQAIMQALEIKELRKQDFKIPFVIWDAYADALLEADKEHRDRFREKVHKLLEASK